MMIRAAAVTLLSVVSARSPWTYRGLQYGADSDEQCVKAIEKKCYRWTKRYLEHSNCIKTHIAKKCTLSYSGLYKSWEPEATHPVQVCPATSDPTSALSYVDLEELAGYGNYTLTIAVTRSKNCLHTSSQIYGLPRGGSDPCTTPPSQRVEIQGANASASFSGPVIKKVAPTAAQTTLLIVTPSVDGVVKCEFEGYEAVQSTVSMDAYASVVPTTISSIASSLAAGLHEILL